METSTHYTHGFSTIEILIAFAVGITFIAAALMIVYSDPSRTAQILLDHGHITALDTFRDTYGLRSAIRHIEDTRIALSLEWDRVFSVTQDAVHGGLTYIHTPHILDIAPCIKQITHTTSWGGGNNRARYTTFTTLSSDLMTARALSPGRCDPTPPSTWNAPETTAALTADILEGQGTDIAVLHKDNERYVFLTTLPISALDTNDMWVVDATDPIPTHPPLITALNTGPKGLNGIALAGSYAYVIQNDNTDQIKIIDLGDPTSPVVLPTAFTLPNISTTCSPLGVPCGREVVSIAYYGGYLYVGTKYLAFGSPGTNEEFHVICIDDEDVLGCSAETPVWRDSYNVNHNVLAIDIHETQIAGMTKRFAYLGLSDTSGTSPELMIFDVSNPTAVSPVGSVNFPGTLYGTAVFAIGNTVYVGRQRATGSNKDFYIIDTTDPYHPIERGGLKLNLTTGGSTVTSIHVQGPYAFVSTSDPTLDRGFQVLDITDPAHIHATPRCNTYTYAQGAAQLTYADNMIFIANKTNEILRIINDSPHACTP